MSRISLILHKAEVKLRKCSYLPWLRVMSRISYECRWGLTVFYPTKVLFFWWYHWLVRVSTVCFWCISTLYGLMHMLTVKPLRCINTLWLGQYVRYTPAKSFEVWLQWDRNMVYMHRWPIRAALVCTYKLRSHDDILNTWVHDVMSSGHMITHMMTLPTHYNTTCLATKHFINLCNNIPPVYCRGKGYHPSEWCTTQQLIKVQTFFHQFSLTIHWGNT